MLHGLRPSTIASFLVLSALATPAAAITFAFSGKVTTFLDTRNLLGGAVGEGTPITGTWSYDEAAENRSPGTSVGTYLSPVPPHGISIDAGSIRFRPDPSAEPFEGANLLVQVRNAPFEPFSRPRFPRPGLPTDELNAIGVDRAAGSVDPSLRFGVNLSFQDGFAAEGDALDSTELPTEPPDLSSFEATFFNIMAEDTSGFEFLLAGSIDAIDFAPDAAVPEPGAALLFAAGAGCLVWRQGRAAQ